MEPNEATIQELEKLLSMLKEGRFLQTSEFVTVIKAVANVVKTLRQENGDSNAAAIASMDKIDTQLKKVLAVHKELSSKTDNISSSATVLSKHFNDTVTKLGIEWNKMRQEMSLIKDGEPGKDADQATIVAEVLAQIKLPEQQAIILDDGEEIVEKINDLATDDDDLKIDAKHIKNLPKPQGGRYGGGAVNSPIKGLVAGNNIEIEDDPTFAGFKNISLTPQITVALTAPANPEVGDLWIDIN
jgi:hypothetical protein